jgi:uncharacterized protein (TIGR00299 family) protein
VKLAYFDCFSGISGDMCLGALVDAGVSLEVLKRELRKLPVRGFSLSGEKVERGGMAATKVHVKARGKGSRRWKDVREIIEGSALSPGVKARGLSVFKSLFQAEARVHGKRYDRVHLHELGALDAMVDIMGTLILVERLGIGEVCASAVNMGGGSTRTSHGTIPVPSPAAAELLKDVPVYSSRDDFELTTPTGAALIRALATDFGPLPAMRVEEVGVGAGNKDFADMPNILRVFVGTGGPGGGEEVMVMETNLDDMDPRVVGYVAERLLEAGALDVWLTQVVMKKGRPGVKLSVLARREHRPGLQDIIFRETTTLGVRMWSAGRVTLGRNIRKVNTRFGTIRLKEAVLEGAVLRSVPEYEDCVRAARKHGVPLREVMEEAKGAG